MQPPPSTARPAVITRAADRRRFASPSASTALVMPPEATEGAWACMDATLNTGAGAPPHVHRYTTELFYVLEGCLSATVGTDTTVLHTGDALLVPPGVVHGFVNPGPTSARVLTVAWPGTHADFLEGIAAVLTRTQPGEAARAAGLSALCAQYDQQPVAVPQPVLPS